MSVTNVTPSQARMRMEAYGRELDSVGTALETDILLRAGGSRLAVHQASTLSVSRASAVHTITSATRPLVSQGSLVRIGAGSAATTWTVIGPAADGQIELGRRGTGGALLHAQMGAAQLVLENPQVAAGAQVIEHRPGRAPFLAELRPDDPFPWEVTDLPPVHATTVDLRSITGDEQWRTARWSDVLAQNPQLLRGVEVVPPASVDHALNLAALDDAKVAVINDVDGGTGRLLATERSGAGAPARLARSAEGGLEWFEQRHHVNLRPDGPFPVLYGSPTMASMDGEGPIMRAGGFDSKYRDLIHRLDANTSTKRALTNGVNELDRQLDAITTHELGHRFSQLVLGSVVTGNQSLEAEQRTVREAISDAFSAARSGTETLADRNLRELPKGARTLDEYRSSLLRMGSGFDEHLGTQLLTHPLAELSDHIGWDATGELLAAATHRAGARLARGEIAAVDFREFAGALRLGAGSRLVDNPTALHAFESALRAVHL